MSFGQFAILVGAPKLLIDFPINLYKILYTALPWTMNESFAG